MSNIILLKDSSTVPYESSLAFRFPAVAKDWNYKKNPKKLTPKEVRPFSIKKVWWHNGEKAVEQVIRNRTSNLRKIPKKSAETSGIGKSKKECCKLLLSNNLAITYPEIAAEWNYEKNGDLRPEDFFTSSHQRISWKCSEGHSWETAITNRVDKQTGCPICYRNSLKLCNLNKELFKELDLERNKGIDLYSLSAKSGKKVWWICQKCGRSFTTTVKLRTDGRNCDLCYPKEIEYETSLEFRYPEISKEWHPTLNGNLRPDQITSMSNKLVWWKCKDHPEHEPWQAPAFERTLRGNRCTTCGTRKRGRKRLNKETL